MRLPAYLFAALLAAASAAAQTTAPPRDAPAPTNQSRATIRGRILDAVTGEPIPGAIVLVMPSTVSARMDAGPLQTAAMRNGTYEVTGLLPGEYVVVAGPADLSAVYLHQAYGAPLPIEAGGYPPAAPGIHLSAGETLDEVDLRLPRALAIDGRVVNDYGEALADVQVKAELVGAGSPMPAAPTDDRGTFRLFGLAPGRYRLCARPERGVFGGALDSAVHLRLVRTCHPSALIDSDGEVITLTNADVEGLVIHMRRSGTFTLSGRVVDGSGGPALDAHVSLTRITKEGSSSRSTPETRSGTFIVRGVTPGEYVLTASAGHSTDPNERTSRERGFLAVRVESDVSGLVLATSPGATITGRIVFDGAPPPRRGLGVAVRRSPASSHYVSGPEGAPVREDLTFELARLHGPLALAVTGLPEGWTVASIAYRGKEIADVPIEFTSVASADDLVVRVTNRTARLTVRAIDEKGGAVSGAQVILLPVDQQRWPFGLIWGPGPMSQVVAPGLDAIRPGDYFVVALPMSDVIALQRDLSLIGALAKAGQRITLEAGEQRSIDVRITPPPQR